MGQQSPLDSADGDYGVNMRSCWLTGISSHLSWHAEQAISLAYLLAS